MTQARFDTAIYLFGVKTGALDHSATLIIKWFIIHFTNTCKGDTNFEDQI